MVEKIIHLRWFYGGHFEIEPRMRYLGGTVTVEENVDSYRISHADLLGRAKDLGYKHIGQLYCKGLIVGETKVFSLLNHNIDVIIHLEFVKNGGTMELFIEHVVDLPDVIEVNDALLMNVSWDGNPLREGPNVENENPLGEGANEEREYVCAEGANVQMGNKEGADCERANVQVGNTEGQDCERGHMQFPSVGSGSKPSVDEGGIKGSERERVKHYARRARAKPEEEVQHVPLGKARPDFGFTGENSLNNRLKGVIGEESFTLILLILIIEKSVMTNMVLCNTPSRSTRKPE
ncbi:hypothetical protein JCGZ_03797 [Jatropha curcas]|uniref:PB1-like domain-containing protein n=1 Tax=Jatropha curcas TaxID=180498 RepID=A0A067KXQ4_JATCU|nr:hypothetical protein JCGZ_03797 [Jatropha curcas]